MTTRAEIVAIARSWIGTPWMHQASVKGIGADCVGFARGVSYESGMINPRADFDPAVIAVRGYGRTPYRGTLERICAMFMDPVAIEEIQLADWLLFRFNDAPQHLGIVSSLEPMRVIHALAMGARKVCEHGLDNPWRQKQSWRDLIVSAWRYREL